MNTPLGPGSIAELEAAIARDLTRAISGVMEAYARSLGSRGYPSLPHLQQAAIRAMGYALGALEGADQSPCSCGECLPEITRARRTHNRAELVRHYRAGIAAGTVDARDALGLRKDH